MNERLIEPPVNLAISMDAARRAARAPGTALDAELDEKVRGITEDAEHKTGRAFITQTWELTGDAFPDAIKLPHPPIASVLYVKFYDVDGVQQTLDPQDYLVDTKSEPGWILPAPGRTWPTTAARINAVEVQVVCGYGDDYSSVPPAIQQYITGMLENEYYPNPNAQFLERRLDRAMVY
jgi:uncharacterized phiE125 gp8 family phage protein